MGTKSWLCGVLTVMGMLMLLGARRVYGDDKQTSASSTKKDSDDKRRIPPPADGWLVAAPGTIWEDKGKTYSLEEPK